MSTLAPRLLLLIDVVIAYSVGALTHLNPENLNVAKEAYEEATDTNMDITTFESVLDDDDLRPATRTVVRRQVDQGESGEVSFGELVPFVRGGTEGVISDNDASVLRKGLASASPANGLRNLSKDRPDEEVLDALHCAFLQHDTSDTGTIPWNLLHPLAEAYTSQLNVKSADRTDLVAQIPTKPVSQTRSQLSFEDWYVTPLLNSHSSPCSDFCAQCENVIAAPIRQLEHNKRFLQTNAKQT